MLLPSVSQAPIQGRNTSWKDLDNQEEEAHIHQSSQVW
jgi:hypothetical protein